MRKKIYYYQQYMEFEGENNWGFNDEFFKTEKEIKDKLIEIFEENQYIQSINICELDLETYTATERESFIDREDVLGYKTYNL